MSGVQASPRTFDLSDISRILWKKWLRYRWSVNIFLTGFLAFGAVFFAYWAVVDSLAGQYLYKGRADIVFVAFFAVFAGVMYWSGHFVAKPASALVLTPNELEIRYPSTGPRRMQWSDPKFKLEISTSYHATLSTHLRDCRFWWKPRLFMRDDAADAIVTAARLAGLEVRAVKDPNSTSGEATLIRASGADARLPQS